jgi:small-conductance mechanosensitive channel
MLGTSDTRPELRVIGLTGWAVLLGLCLAWEGVGLVFGHEHWPSMSDLLRTVSRPVVGRWILLALWIWLGWHLFVRGWQPLLRGEQAPQHPAVTMTFAEIVRQVLTPLLATYVLVLGMIAMTARRARRASRLPRPETREPAGALRQVGRILSLLLVGYAAFFAIVLTYYAVVANESPEFLRAAASGGAFITFAVALPGLLLASAVAWIAGRRPRGSPAA